MNVNNLLSIYKPNDPYELLISQIVRIESQPKQELEIRKSAQEKLKSILSDLNSKLSAFDGILDTLTDPLSNPFGTKKATVSDETFFTVAATSKAALGTHKLAVERLAQTDTRLSKEFSETGNSLRSKFNKQQTFKIEVAHPTDTDPDNRIKISVTVDPTGTKDGEILREIADAINQAMDEAVSNGDITSDERAQATVVTTSTGKVRLSLRSGKTGYTYRLDFKDSKNKVLEELELNASQLSTATDGGMVYDVGTDPTDSLLNSKIIVDGLTIYRDGNTLTDVFPGLTITLKKPTTSEQEFTIDTDKEAIKKEIESFIDAYNELQKFIQQKTLVDGEADIRAELAGDTTFTGLRYNLRTELAREVTGQPADAPTLLSDIGITVNRDGTLTLSDEEALFSALEDNQDAVASLFNGTDGYATRLKSRLDAFLGSKGIVNTRIGVIKDRIDRLDTEIKKWEERLSRRESMLREQFAQVQETLALLNGQQATLNSYFINLGF